jgi:FO synthase
MMSNDIDPDAIEAIADVPLERLMARARQLRDEGHGSLITYSRKVFVPLTRLCRDVCHYCTFATAPSRLNSPYLTPEEVLEIARKGDAAGCTEVLFTLGDKPERRYRSAARALAQRGAADTIGLLREAAEMVLQETGLLPHLNPGLLSADDFRRLRPVSASMGMMLECLAPRLFGPGGPHHGSPDKAPDARLESLEAAGAAAVPFTTGLLVGIGETRKERLETIAAIGRSHGRHGHVQEVIIQPFRAKPGTRMAAAPEPPLVELLWTIAAARVLLGPMMSIQSPPNLTRPDAWAHLVDAGLNDWGGISPVTTDHVNPEAAWPSIPVLAAGMERIGRRLVPRLPVYPHYVATLERWVDPEVRPHVLKHADASGWARDDRWISGSPSVPPPAPLCVTGPSGTVRDLLRKANLGEPLEEEDLVNLLEARGPDVGAILEASDEARLQVCGDDVTYVINRNINYTNICTYACGFCAFSKGRRRRAGGDAAYLLDLEEVARRAAEAAALGASEICMQGGIHPGFTGETYLALLRVARAAAPGLHIHAFSPLEVLHGSRTIGIPVAEYLSMLRAEGLGSLPGTAAEILDDEVRAQICPDKLSAREWVEVVETAHALGIATTATMMFGHVESTRHWARHLLAIRAIQERTGGFTEFVPLPFVAGQAPIYRRGRARPGPTWREVALVHAVARLALRGWVDNIQGSWVKLGREGLARILRGGANDAGGTLMNESITRAAGATNGQEFPARDLQAVLAGIGRRPVERTTLYELRKGDAGADRARARAEPGRLALGPAPPGRVGAPEQTIAAE